jgi:hypothetical protein
MADTQYGNNLYIAKLRYRSISYRLILVMVY